MTLSLRLPLMGPAAIMIFVGCAANTALAPYNVLAPANLLPSTCVYVALVDRGATDPNADKLNLRVSDYASLQSKDIAVMVNGSNGCPTGDDLTIGLLFELPQDSQKRWAPSEVSASIPANSMLPLDQIAFLAAYSQTASNPITRPGTYELRTHISITKKTLLGDGGVTTAAFRITKTIVLTYLPRFTFELVVHATLLAGGSVIAPADRRQLLLTAVASPFGLHGRLLWSDVNPFWGTGLEIIPFGAGGTLQTGTSTSTASIGAGAFFYPIDIVLPDLQIDLGIGGGILLFYTGRDPVWIIGLSTLAPYYTKK